MLESVFKKKLIDRILRSYPGAVVLKADANYIQGIPDHFVLYGDTWVSFEAKRSARAPHRPNQSYYVGLLNEMSYASFIYPENEEEVFNEIQRSFSIIRPARFSVRK
jgi:hypothetical protein